MTQFSVSFSWGFYDESSARAFSPSVPVPVQAVCFAALAQHDPGGSNGDAWWYPVLGVPCVSPISGWLGRTLTDKGKRPVVFTRSLGFADQPRLVPCGRCSGCRASRAAQWSTRAYLEMLSHEQSYFFTLTYDDDHLPDGGVLVPRHLTLFWKSLRRKLARPLRYLACGEYGDSTNRPHYHAIVFGLVLSDLVPYSSTLSTSSEVSACWPHGQLLIGEATSASAAYVAGYVAKKLANLSYPPGYLPPFLRVSNKPALGRPWVSSHLSDLFYDRIYIGEGRTAPVPKHILSLLEVDRPEVYRNIKRLRREAAGFAERTLDRPSANSVEANILARQRVREPSL